MSTAHELRATSGRPERRRRPRHRRSATAQKGRDAIAIFGLFGCGNLGNDASLEAMLSLLRDKRPQTRVFCICRKPAIVSQTFGIEAVPIRREKRPGLARAIDRLLLRMPGMAAGFFSALRTIRKAGVVVVPGTGILDDFGDRPAGMPFDIFRWCLAARLMGTRIAFVSIGAGPIGNRLSRWLMTRAAGMADYRSYRDVASLEFLGNAGVDTHRDGLYPDLAFSLPVPPVAGNGASRRLVVGIGLMNYRGWYGFDEDGQAVFDSYIARMAMFVRLLLERGHGVRLITGDEGDARAVDALLAALEEADAEKLVHEPVHSIHDVIGQVLRTDLVIATRFHNVVAALMAGRPVISLGYAAKNELLLEKMGLGSYCQQVGSFDVGLLAEQFERLAADREEHARWIERKVSGFRTSLALQDEYLLATVL